MPRKSLMNPSWRKILPNTLPDSERDTWDGFTIARPEDAEQARLTRQIMQSGWVLIPPPGAFVDSIAKVVSRNAHLMRAELHSSGGLIVHFLPCNAPEPRFELPPDRGPVTRKRGTKRERKAKTLTAEQRQAAQQVYLKRAKRAKTEEERKKAWASFKKLSPLKHADFTEEQKATLDALSKQMKGYKGTLVLYVKALREGRYQHKAQRLADPAGYEECKRQQAIWRKKYEAAFAAYEALKDKYKRENAESSDSPSLDTHMPS